MGIFEPQVVHPSIARVSEKVRDRTQFKGLGNSSAGCVGRYATRSSRDAIQRACSRQRQLDLWRELPKSERRAIIKRERLSKEAAQAFDEVEPQSGAYLAMGAVGGSIATAGVMYAAHIYGARLSRLISRAVSTPVAAGVSAVVNEVSKVLHDMKVAFVKAVGNLWVIPVAVVLMWLFSQIPNGFVHMMVWPIAAAILGTHWDKFAPAFQRVETQADVSLFSRAVGIALSCIYLPEDNQKLVSEVMRRMGSLPKATEGFDTFFKGCIECVETVINFLLSFVGKGGVCFGDATAKAVRAWVNDAEALEIEIRRLDSEDPDLKLLQRLETVIMDGMALRTSINDGYHKNVLQKVIERLEVRKRPFASALAATKTFRVEPLFLLLHGSPGQGKTTLITKIASVVLMLAGECSPDEVLQNLWQKGDSKYWESYFGQKCVVMDDCFQEKAVPGMDTNEFLQLIKVVSSWSCPLNMASLDLKGKFFFNSPLILGTTNISGIKNTTAGQVIEEVMAVARRVKYAVSMTAREDWTVVNSVGNKVLDYQKVEDYVTERMRLLNERALSGTMVPTQMDVLEVFPWHAWVVNVVDPYTGAEGEKDISLKRLVLKVAQDLRTRKQSHAAAVSNMVSFNKLLKDAAPIDLDAQLAVETQSGGFVGRIVDALQETRLKWFPADAEVVDRYTDFVRVAGLNRGLGANNGVSRTRFNQEPKRVLNMVGLEVANDAKRIVDASCDPRVEAATDYLRYYPDLSEAYNKIYTELDEPDVSWKSFVDECTRWVSAFCRWLRRTPGIGFMLGVGSAVGIGVAIVAVPKIVRFLCALAGTVIETVTSVYQRLLVSLGLAQTDKLEAQSNVPSFNGSPPKKHAKHNFPKATTQSGYDGTQDDARHAKIYANSYKLFVKTVDGKDRAIGQVLMLVHKAAAMPQHFRDDLATLLADGIIADDATVWLAKSDNCANCASMPLGTFLALNSVKLDKSDVEIVDFGRTMNNAGKTIIQFLFEEKELEDFLATKQPVRLDVSKAGYDADDKLVIRQQVLQTARAWYIPELSFGGRECHGVIGYQLDTTKGMCGAPLMASSPRHYKGHCLLGIHAAGTLRTWDREGYAIPLTREAVDDALQTLGVAKCKLEDDLKSRGVELLDVDVETQSGLKDMGLVSGSFELLGAVDQPVVLAPGSKLKKTFLGEEQVFGDCGQAPAHLRPVLKDGEWKYPMVEGLRPYQSPVLYNAALDLPVYVGIATLPFRQQTIHDYKGLLTFEEACTTREGLKLKPINRSSSAGYPYCLRYGNGKKEILGAGDQCDFDSPAALELRERVSDIVEAARKGERLAHLCVDFLKDETRPYAKVDAVVTRVISGSPLDYVIACRMYFGAFMAACFRNNITTGLAPGVNPYSEWWRIANFLLDKGKQKCFDGDFKHFDASEQPQVHWVILDFINQWYGDSAENQLIRRVLWLDLVHSRHITGPFGDARFVVQWNKSLPSGHPLTTIVNSFYSLVALTACYCTLTGDVRDMWCRVALVVYGDDNLAAADDSVIDVFNQCTVAAEMERLFSLKYTSADKGAELVPYKALDKCAFLQRGFVREENGIRGGWSAPLRFQSFLFPSYWYKDARTMHETTITNLQGTLGELSLHKPDVWNEWFPRVKAALARLDAVPLYEDRVAWRTETYARENFWF